MQQSFGAYLRQLRRQHNLTQIELGDEEFSKSYVSAVELEKVVPSHEALQHFARKLAVPIEELEQVLHESEPQSLFALRDGSLAAFEEEYDQEVLTLLEMMVQENHNAPLSLPKHLTQLSVLSDASVQSQDRRAHYAFLRGLMEQEAGHRREARALLEYALALISPQYHVAVLDALGNNYYQSKEYHSALSYHQRAHALLKEGERQTFDLAVQVEIHCGNDCRMLKLYQEACRYFESARRRLRVNHNMKLAGELYLGLGYSTFAMMKQPSLKLAGNQSQSKEQEVEKNYQLAIGYLLQSRTLYQVSSDFYGEMYARLVQATALLSFHSWRQQQALASDGETRTKALLINSGTLLDEAGEQCRQIVLNIQEKYGKDERLSTEIEEILYTAIAALIRMHIYRAAQTRQNGYADTAAREQIEALYIGRQVMGLLEQDTIAWSKVQKIVKMPAKEMGRFDVLPDIINVALLVESKAHSAVVLSEAVFVLGEVFEEMVEKEAREGQSQQDYEFADRCFQYALDIARSEVPSERRDGGYFERLYRNYLLIIERRWRVISIFDESHERLIALASDVFERRMS